MKRAVVLLGLCVAISAVGCGPNGGGNGNNGEEPDPEEPLELSGTDLGVTFHHGEAGILPKDGDAAGRAIDETKATFGTAFLDVQLYDEHTWVLGEWEVQPHPDAGSSEYRTGRHFSEENPGDADFEPRAGDMVDEVEGAFGNFGAKGFDRMGIILDVWRMRGDWYVRWDGKLKQESNRIGEGDYGFFRKEMTDDMISQLGSVAGAHNMEYAIVGSDMGRLLARKGKKGIAPDEFSNFRQFYRKAVSEIREKSPGTKVGVGFDWDRFVKHVAPAFGEGKKGEVPPRETLRKAFRAVIYPFARRGRLLALKSYRRASDDEAVAEYYGFLADLDEMFEMEGISVIWYSVGSPVEDSVSYRKQRTYLEKFIEWNRGVEPDLVVWRSMLNIDGADRGDQKIGGRCKKLVEIEKKRFGLEKSHCFDGLYESAYQKKEVYEFIRSESQKEGGGMNGEQ